MFWVFVRVGVMRNEVNPEVVVSCLERTKILDCHFSLYGNDLKVDDAYHVLIKSDKEEAFATRVAIATAAGDGRSATCSPWATTAAGYSSSQGQIVHTCSPRIEDIAGLFR
jgi:hypothetical protein